MSTRSLTLASATLDLMRTPCSGFSNAQQGASRTPLASSANRALHSKRLTGRPFLALAAELVACSSLCCPPVSRRFAASLIPSASINLLGPALESHSISQSIQAVTGRIQKLDGGRVVQRPWSKHGATVTNCAVGSGLGLTFLSPHVLCRSVILPSLCVHGSTAQTYVGMR